jgi:hypothetical protein
MYKSRFLIGWRLKLTLRVMTARFPQNAFLQYSRLKTRATTNRPDPRRRRSAQAGQLLALIEAP